MKHPSISRFAAYLLTICLINFNAYRSENLCLTFCFPFRHQSFLYIINVTKCFPQKKLKCRDGALSLNLRIAARKTQLVKNPGTRSAFHDIVTTPLQCTPCSWSLFSPVVFSMQLSVDSETVHHPYISTSFCGKHFCTLVSVIFMVCKQCILELTLN